MSKFWLQCFASFLLIWHNYMPRQHSFMSLTAVSCSASCDLNCCTFTDRMHWDVFHSHGFSFLKAYWITAHPIRYGYEMTQRWKSLVKSSEEWPQWSCMRRSLTVSYKWDKMASLCPPCTGLHKGLPCSQQWLRWWAHRLWFLLWWYKSHRTFPTKPNHSVKHFKYLKQDFF